MFNAESLSESLRPLGIVDAGSIFEELAAAYDQPARHYHGRAHIDDCLSRFRSHRGRAERPCEVEVAIWFHDAVYDTRRADNEEQSAAWAESYLRSVNVDRNAVGRIAALILATKSHGGLSGVDQQLMVDVDLSILGRGAETFERYDRAIRAEYAWVPEDPYRAARASVLKGFLDRDAIYSTESFRARYERPARHNIARKLEDLISSQPLDQPGQM